MCWKLYVQTLLHQRVNKIWRRPQRSLKLFLWINRERKLNGETLWLRDNSGQTIFCRNHSRLMTWKLRKVIWWAIGIWSVAFSPHNAASCAEISSRRRSFLSLNLINFSSFSGTRNEIWPFGAVAHVFVHSKRLILCLVIINSIGYHLSAQKMYGLSLKSPATDGSLG